MPNINTLAEVLAQPEWPYHYHYDNLPLRQILLRQDMINSAVDANTLILESAKGTAADLTARLNMTQFSDGSLRPDVIPVHSIDLVLDTGATSVDTSQPYVKMMSIERAKLATISSNATALQISFVSNPLDPVDVIFRDQLVKFDNSATISWRLSSDSTHTNNVMYADLRTPTPTVPYFNVVPATLDYKNYSIGQPIVSNSLRVHVNGIRLSDVPLPVPHITISSCTSSCWTTLSYVSVDTAGTFQLNTPISAAYVIRIDYNRTS
jgi:hypothetical protein